MCGWRILTTLICIPFPHVRSAMICLYDNSLGLLSPVSSCPALDAPPPLSAAPAALAALLAPPVASAVSFSTSWANDRDHQATLLVRKWWSWLSSDYKNGSGIVLGIIFSVFFWICSSARFPWNCSMLELEAAISTFWRSNLSFSMVFATSWCSNFSCWMVFCD